MSVAQKTRRFGSTLLFGCSLFTFIFKIAFTNQFGKETWVCPRSAELVCSWSVCCPTGRPGLQKHANVFLSLIWIGRASWFVVLCCSVDFLHLTSWDSRIVKKISKTDFCLPNSTLLPYSNFIRKKGLRSSRVTVYAGCLFTTQNKKTKNIIYQRHFLLTS